MTSVFKWSSTLDSQSKSWKNLKQKESTGIVHNVFESPKVIGHKILENFCDFIREATFWRWLGCWWKSREFSLRFESNGLCSGLDLWLRLALQNLERSRTPNRLFKHKQKLNRYHQLNKTVQMAKAINKDLNACWVSPW